DGKKGPRAPDLRPGLIAVGERIRDRRDALFGDLVALRPGVDDLVAQVQALASRLGGPPPDVEIERKYLLRQMPKMPKLHGAEAIRIEQGYLPGTRLKERLRRSRGPDGSEKLERTIKLGAGVRRTEVEEECPRALFDKLWPLTRAQRIVKTR